MGPHLPDDHPRAESLRVRHLITDGLEKNIVTQTGLIAHGRGEAYDYLLGEETAPAAHQAIEVAVALMLLADRPVISVNGNIAALVPVELVELSEILNAPLEINLFYRAAGRVEAITRHLEHHGAKNILGNDPAHAAEISELSSLRRVVDARGIKIADVVLVPLEDGDRTEALVREGKKVIAIDLNPLSRTSLAAQVTVVDNVLRALPLMIARARTFLDQKSREELADVVENFDNAANLAQMLEEIRHYLSKFAREKIPARK